MKYFELEDDMSRNMRNRWHIGEIYLPDGSEPRLRAGIRLDDFRDLCAEVHHVGHVLEFCCTSFGVPIATSALASAIESIAACDVQCLPLRVAGQSGMMVVNALRLIRCVDETRSEFIKWSELDNVPEKIGQYRQITKLTLVKSAIPSDAHFFRIDGWRIALIVSETLKDAMERVGCYGAKFIELETV